jgi:ABC transport system ATP-binding/permease protein
MHYLSAEALTKAYGIQPLFENISFHVSEGDKIALVARNGMGKTTLLRILAGKETADSGKCWVHKDVYVALFEQDPVFDEERSVIDNIFQHNHPVLDAIKNYETVCESGSEEALNKAIEEMDQLGAWNFDAKVKQILSRLNIHQLQQKTGTLSGGQKKRIALARTLIDVGFEHRHTLLLMDEPTNHLDVEMVEWLEHYLNQEKVTLLLVTHDRYFLDAVCDEIWEIDRSNFFVYKGSYENYLEKKAQRLENESAFVDKARNRYRKELEWMRKQPRARTTKSKSRIDSFYDLETIAKTRFDEQQLELQLKMSRLGGKVVEMKKVNKAYGEQVILKGFDYNFKKGERIAIVGRNGVGKSTFIGMLQGLIPPDSGKINIGDTVVFGYYSQQGLEVKEDMRVIEYVKDIAENFPLAAGGSLSAAQFLQLFLFDPDRQFTYLSSLSGGERKRLLLLSILFRNPNFLILDEPTNDLDLPTLEVLENFLAEFAGCLILVTHDRYFTDRLADHLFVLEGEGQVRDFPGNYSDYRIAQKKLESEKNEKPVALSSSKENTLVQPTPVKKRMGFKEKREFELLEKELETLNKEKEGLTTRLNSGTLPFTELQAAAERIAVITQLLDEKELRWLELSEMAE